MDTSGEPLLDGKIDKWATFKRGGLNIAVFGYVNVEESKAMSTLTGNLKFTDHVRFLYSYFEEFSRAYCTCMWRHAACLQQV